MHCNGRFHILQRGLHPLPVLKLPGLGSDSNLGFWRTARVIAEAIFYILPLSYRHSLSAYCEKFVADGATLLKF